MAEAFDALVVGAGPAGCSCALWLAEYRLRVALVERLARPCAGLDAFDFPQDGLLGHPRRPLAALAADFRAHLQRRDDIACWCGVEPQDAEHDGRHWTLRLSDGRQVQATAVVLATGVEPVRPAQWFDDPALSQGALFDAVSLTLQRDALARRRVLLLGGGDNAAENALALHALGARVVLAARGALRAQRRFVEALAAEPGIEQRVGQPLPRLARGPGGGFLATWDTEAPRAFDAVAVLFGYRARPVLPALAQAAAAQARGVFVAGDASQRLHPCIPSALGDGAHTARQVERWLASFSPIPA